MTRKKQPILKVAVAVPVSRAFDYLPPDETPAPQPGCRVRVPFGARQSFVLVVEQATVARWGTTRMALTFFTLNGIISAVLGLLGAVDILV